MKQLILSLLTILALNLPAQNHWELTWSSDSLGIYAEGLAQINDTTYLTISAIYNHLSDTSYDSKLITINQYGEVQDSLIPYAASRASFRIFNLNNNDFLTISRIWNGGDIKMALTRFDANLNMLWHQSYFLPDGFNGFTSDLYACEDSQNNIYVACLLSEPYVSGVITKHNVLLSKFTATGDSLLMKNLYPYNHDYHYIEGLSILNDTTLFAITSPPVGDVHLLLELDESFNERQTHSQYSMWNYIDFIDLEDIIRLPDYSGFLLYARNLTDERLELYKVNNQLNIVDSVSFPYNSSYLLIGKNLAITEEGNIYMIYSDVYDSKTVVKYSTDLKEQWRCFLYSDTPPMYSLDMDIIPTKDGFAYELSCFLRW